MALVLNTREAAVSPWVRNLRRPLDISAHTEGDRLAAEPVSKTGALSGVRFDASAFRNTNETAQRSRWRVTERLRGLVGSEVRAKALASSSLASPAHNGMHGR